jgi:triphosphoribosyl-dephospho-CoA synthase
VNRSLDPGLVAAAYVAACRAEIDALKPGNVHIFADGHGMTAAQMLRSAEASAGPLSRPGASVGARVRAAVDATLAEVKANTNLGIVLLAAPLARAADLAGDPRSALSRVLASLDVAEAVEVFAAIRHANPGGLGRSDRHDVSAMPIISLREAMATAADRDRIARAYVTDYDDVFEVGLPALAAARGRKLDAAWCTTAVYLAYLTRFPDTHIARKFGVAKAEQVRRQSFALLRRIELGPSAFEALLAFDGELKSEGINPGTSADFTVATLFADALIQQARHRQTLAGPE